MTAHLLRRPDGSVVLVEGTVARPVRSGILAAGLEQAFGEARADDGAALTDGPPVDVLAGPSGQPFVVVDGRRCTLRGLPTPRRVDAAAYDDLPDGGRIDVAGANVPRARLEQVTSARRPSGTAGGLASIPRRAVGKARRTVRRLVR